MESLSTNRRTHNHFPETYSESWMNGKQNKYNQPTKKFKIAVGFRI